VTERERRRGGAREEKNVGTREKGREVAMERGKEGERERGSERERERRREGVEEGDERLQQPRAQWSICPDPLPQTLTRTHRLKQDSNTDANTCRYTPRVSDRWRLPASPRVTVARACVSPRVNSEEPCTAARQRVCGGERH
jgi:hypothetical protein